MKKIETGVLYACVLHKISDRQIEGVYKLAVCGVRGLLIDLKINLKRPPKVNYNLDPGA